jgi:hypothetical protein
MHACHLSLREIILYINTFDRPSPFSCKSIDIVVKSIKETDGIVPAFGRREEAGKRSGQNFESVYLDENIRSSQKLSMQIHAFMHACKYTYRHMQTCAHM